MQSSPVVVFSLRLCAAVIEVMVSTCPTSQVPKTSISKCSMTPSISPKVSIKPFTATRSIRFVVASYSMHSAVPGLPSASGPWVAAPVFSKENERRTRGDSSAST